MGKKDKTPVTPALRALRASGVEFEERLYSYVEHGGAQHAAQCLGIDLYSTIKTLVFEDENKRPLLVLMHGDHDVAVGLLARAIGTKRVDTCAPEKESNQAHGLPRLWHFSLRHAQHNAHLCRREYTNSIPYLCQWGKARFFSQTDPGCLG